MHTAGSKFLRAALGVLAAGSSCRRLARGGLLASAMIVLGLSACGREAGSAPLPAPSLDAVRPQRVSAEGGARVVVTGTNLFEVVGGDGFGGELAVDVCGGTLADLELTGDDRRVVVPPGHVVTLRVGGTLTGTLPAVGPDPAGEVTVRLPDGRSGTLAAAVECYDPAPTVARFAPGEGTAARTIAFAWFVASPAEEALACTLDPGDGSEPYVVEDCLATTRQAHEYASGGTYEAVLTVTDAAGRAASRELEVVVGGGHAPIGTLTELATDEDVPLDFTLTGIDPDGDPIAFTIVETPAFGSLVGTVPHLTYLPDANAHGVDRFAYTVSDADGTSDAVQVDVSVAPVNDAPVARDVVAATTTDEPVVFDLLASDVDGDALGYEVGEPESGTATLRGVGPSVTYTPAPGFVGTVTFAYAVDDGTTSSEATVTVTVEAAAEPPPGAPVFVSAAPGSVAFPYDVDYVVAAADPEGDPVTITASDLPDTLTLSDHGDGTATLSGSLFGVERGRPVGVTLVASDGVRSTEWRIAIDRLPFLQLDVRESSLGTNLGASYAWSVVELDGTGLDCVMDFGYGPPADRCIGSLTVTYPNVVDGVRYEGGLAATDVHGNVVAQPFVIGYDGPDCPEELLIFICIP